MNRLLTLLTATGFWFVMSGELAAAMPVGPGLGAQIGTHDITRIQLGGGGPVGGGPNGGNNGTGSGVGNGAFRGGVAGAVNGRANGIGTSSGLRSNGGNQQPNGSKPAPMQPNGVRKVQ